MPDDLTLPSVEVLVALVVSLREELTAVRGELERAQTRIAELEARLAANSSNSSKPPSSDGLAKPAPKTRSLRGKTRRESGGQPGHDGSTLRQVDRPDHEVPHEPGPCGDCGRSLAGRPVTSIERRQCFDLPPVTIEVTEHQLIERECGCGHRTRAAAPPGVDAPVQYGPRIAAVVVYLYVGQFLSKQRTAQALAELFGTPLSAGTVATMTARAASGLAEFLTVVRGRLAACVVVGFDETGLRVAGKLHWVHCARTDKYTLVTCHPRRGTAGIDDLGVLGRFRGVAVHDAWAPYDTYLAPQHQLCCAHAQRELQAVADGAPTDQWCWATQAGDALVAMQRLVADASQAGHDRLDADELAEQVTRYRSAVLIGIEQTAARTGKLMKKHNALAR
ncbi:IS66 family transposase, partial [Micromonosporaceae bacterium Da 78-11]